MDTPSARDAAKGDRLDSWKEIAAYLKRDVRTVQRWERHESLPVHRHLHDERSTAYAYSREIDAWLADRSRHEQEASSSATAAGPAHAPGASSSPRRSSTFLIAAALVCILTLVIVWVLPRRTLEDPKPLSSLSVVFAPSERFREWGPDLALSPDGTTIAYMGAGDTRLHIRRIDQLQASTIDGASGYGPFFSPDGRWVGFKNGVQFMKVAVEGGAPVALDAKAEFIGSADWGSDDFIVYGDTTPEGGHGLYRLPANGGSPRLVAALGGSAEEVQWLTPQSIAAGQVILCTLATTVAAGARFQIVAVSVATGARKVLVDDARHGLYLGDGVLVYLRNNALFAARLDINRLEVYGPHVPAWDDIFTRGRLRSWSSAGGTLVYWPRLRSARRLVWFDRTGNQEPLQLPPAFYQSPRVSSDGRSIVVAIGEQSDVGDVWRHDLATGATVQLTSNGLSGSPLWFPDSAGIVFASARGAVRYPFRLRLDTAAEPEPIAVGPRGPTNAGDPVSWADNGRTLLVSRTGPESPSTLWSVTVDGSREPRPVIVGNGPVEGPARVSPDGRWLAYSARGEIYVSSLDIGRSQSKVSSGGGQLPVWARSGRELFFRSGERLMAAPVTIGPTFSSDPAQPLFHGRFFEAQPGGPNYDVAPGDQRFLMILQGSTEGPDRLNVIQGWKAEILRRLAASR